mgnify:FL=1
MKRAVLGSKGLGAIKPLSDDIAFNTGVDWFTEVFVFYGVLITIAFYELNKAHNASVAQKKQIEDLLVSSKQN